MPTKTSFSKVVNSKAFDTLDILLIHPIVGADILDIQVVTMFVVSYRENHAGIRHDRQQ